MKTFVHQKYSILKEILNLPTNGGRKKSVFIVGPAGSGKSFAVEQIAKDMGLPFYFLSVGSQTSMANILGFIDAHGSYRTTVFREAYEKGGVFLFDEIDAGNANVLVCVNASLAGTSCSFPDGMVKRHENFICVASGNTYGLGANRQYIGRNQLDAASLDRFVVIDWEYDENLEKNLSSNSEWVQVIQAIRKRTEKLGINLVVSPRASIEGSDIRNNTSLDLNTVLEMTVFKGKLDSLTKNRLLERIEKEVEDIEKAKQLKAKQEKAKQKQEQEQSQQGQIEQQTQQTQQKQEVSFPIQANFKRVTKPKVSQKTNIKKIMEDIKKEMSVLNEVYEPAFVQKRVKTSYMMGRDGEFPK